MKHNFLLICRVLVMSWMRQWQEALFSFGVWLAGVVGLVILYLQDAIPVWFLPAMGMEVQSVRLLVMALLMVAGPVYWFCRMVYTLAVVATVVRGSEP